jgi:hypothetical protein
MERVDLTRRDLGPIRAKTALDHVPKQPGLYKLTFQLGGKTYAYIGEAGARGLRSRIRVCEQSYGGQQGRTSFA